MKIDRNTSIKQLLDFKQDEVIEALSTLNSNFGKLKNPILRKLLAKRVSVAEACKIANCTVADFFKTMEKIGFELADNTTLPAELEGVGPGKQSPEHVVELDVRPILAADKDPLKLIMIKANELEADQHLKIINTFEPLPLINLLGSRGFGSYTEVIKPDLIHTYFFKKEETPAPVSTPSTYSDPGYDFDSLLKKYEGKLQVIDVTKLEMPKPMVTILEKLDELKEGEALYVDHKKVPVYLLPHLREKGFEYLIREESSSDVVLLIYKP